MPSAPINYNTAADQTVVAAPAGATQFIRVLGYLLIANGTVNPTWKSGTPSGTALSGPLPLAQNSGAVAPETPEGWFDCAVGQALVLNLDQSVQVSGHVTYAVKG